MVKVFLLIFFSLTIFLVQAQERCATVAHEKNLHQRNPKRETIDQFEAWIKKKISQQPNNITRTTSTSYVVPIVIHVIHNGEAVGSGTNISDAQILSQIQVMNDDFERLNADTTKTLTEFLPVAGKFLITFVLAKQDTDGLATSGIIRVKGSKSSWTI